VPGAIPAGRRRNREVLFTVCVGGARIGLFGAAMRILIVEDNNRLATAVQIALHEQGINADVTGLGRDGEEMAFLKAYDIILLDRMLPDRDGIDVCRSLRRRGLTTPIIMLTALDTTGDKVAGLNAGADDYVTKPFEIEELLARIAALLRRGVASEAMRLTYGELELNLSKRTARRAGQTIRLTSREFALLEFLMRRCDRVVSRSAIGENVWEMNYEPVSNVIDVCVSSLRRKVDKGFSKPLIHTVIGSGYMLSVEPHTA
jgi:two-component system copper resistance phosphate regulon response regulator CusR